MRVLSFDPSLTNWGYAQLVYDGTLVLQDCGVINPPKAIKFLTKQSQKDIATSEHLFTSLCDMVKQADIWIAEVPHGSQSARAMVSYALCCGLLGAFKSYNSHFIAVQASQVKRFIANKKDTTKDEIITWVRTNHPNEQHLIPQAKSKAEHICDAIMACHVALRTNPQEFI